MPFRTDVSGMAPVNYGMVYNQMIGRASNPLQRRRGRETGELLRSYAQNEQDPEVRQALMTAIDQGAFDQMAPTEASRALIQMAEQRKAERINTQREQGVTQLLGAEIPDLDPDLMERLGLDSSRPVGQRADEVKAEHLSRIARQQAGYEQQAMRDAQVNAARTGQPVGQQDISAIRTRSAALAARERGSTLGDIRREQEGYRQQNIGRLADTLSNRVNEAPQYNMPTQQSGMTMYDYAWKNQQKNNRAGSYYGASLGGGNSRGTTRYNIK